MMTKSSPQKFIARSLIGFALRTLLFVCLAAPLSAADTYLAPGKPDGVALLAPPPEPGTAEYAADMATVRAAFKNRTSAEEARAMAEEDTLGITNFAPAIGAFVVPGRFPKTEALLKKAIGEAAQAAKAPKNHWQRQRPCQLDKDLNLGPPETGFSYPSGHSTQGTVYALILAEIFPDKKDAILAIGRQIGWDRVIIAKHFPTDIQAGRVLGQAIFYELEKSAAFQSDLAAAKAEAQSIAHSN
jgi:acid phosphatase (class A)